MTVLAYFVTCSGHQIIGYSLGSALKDEPDRDPPDGFVVMKEVVEEDAVAGVHGGSCSIDLLSAGRGSRFHALQTLWFLFTTQIPSKRREELVCPVFNLRRCEK